MSSVVRIAPEVAEALDQRRAVVALETTLVTHGFPHPEGVRLAGELEEAVRGGGATPAVIGVWNGALQVGLSPEQLATLATTPGTPKLNLANLAACLAAGGSGATTVSATLLAAHRAGIRVFATGGIGGVHRHVEESGDISADLGALARFPVAVVCSGAKAVLDLPKTVEALETLGVPVYGLGTDRFPAFYRRDSGLAVDRRFDAIPTLAAAVRTHLELGAGTGVVVAHPIPAEHEMPREVYERAIAGALEDAARDRIRGRDLTPFLLERLRQTTDGASVFSNRALLLGNARVAAALARALAPR